MPHWKGQHHDDALKCVAATPDLSVFCLTDDQALCIDKNKIDIL